MNPQQGMYRIKRVTLDTITWTPFVVPAGFDAQDVGMENPDTVNAMKIRTDPNDASTEKSIPAGSETSVSGNPAVAIRFPALTTFAYGQMVAGTGPAVLSFGG